MEKRKREKFILSREKYIYEKKIGHEKVYFYQ